MIAVISQPTIQTATRQTLLLLISMALMVASIFAIDQKYQGLATSVVHLIGGMGHRGRISPSGSSWEPSPPGASIVVLAGRATNMP